MAQSFQQAQHGPAFSAGAGATMNGVQGELDRLKGEIDILTPKVEAAYTAWDQSPSEDSHAVGRKEHYDNLVAEKMELSRQRGALQAQLAGNQGQGYPEQVDMEKINLEARLKVEKFMLSLREKVELQLQPRTPLRDIAPSKVNSDGEWLQLKKDN
mmetsp:Transcript_5161/g.8958  ORF Transcript_5161/g.8958 Transcript_5161/m.8958 type:complete len:156 (+) Transcript_5161:132-599(+)